jgi:hypothetical protein
VEYTWEHGGKENAQDNAYYQEQHFPDPFFHEELVLSLVWLAKPPSKP